MNTHVYDGMLKDICGSIAGRRQAPPPSLRNHPTAPFSYVLPRAKKPRLVTRQFEEFFSSQKNEHRHDF